MSGALSGRSALITGGGQGIGRGIALALASQGARIAILDINKDAADATVALLAERGAQAIAIVGDVQAPDDIARSLRETVDQLGGLNILVNNAQTFPLGALVDVADSAAIAGFMSGPIAHWRFMQAAYPHLKGNGVIIGLSSPAAVTIEAASGHGLYSAAKAGIQALIRTAALEWARDSIRAYAVLPVAGSVSTDDFLSDPEMRERTFRSIPLGRLGDAEKDVGGVVAFLCSDGAAYMTGCSIPVDGGAAWLR